MGLAASQGILLSLTARISDDIYEAEKIAQQQMAAAQQTQDVAEEYNKAMNNRILQVNTKDSLGQNLKTQLTYDLLTNQDPFTGLCMRLIDSNGNVVVPSNENSIAITQKDENDKETTSYLNAEDFINTYLKDDTKASEMRSWTLNQLSEYYNKNYSGNTHVANSNYEYLKNEDEHYTFDENCKDPAYLQKMLESGEWTIEQASANSESGWNDIVWQGSTTIASVLDTSDDAAAEAKYESEMRRLEKEDKTLDLRLEQIQTEEKALEQQRDSVKDVIKQDIEQSFKTFA